jgi:hypothetical protein
MKTVSDSTLQALLCGLRGILCLGLICLIVLGAFFWLPAKVHYHVIEKYIFSGGGEGTLIYSGVMLPKSGPYQWVENLETSWEGVQAYVNYGFADVVKFSGEMIDQENLEATIEYDVKLLQGPVSWSAPVEDFQRQPQVGIESDCDCIQVQASDLCEGTSEKDAYEIYSFTADYLTYSPVDQDCTSLSALQAYEIGSCVCAGYARLMTALCRASGIPAQMVLGLVYPDPMFNLHITSFPQNPEETHAWVEYYSEGSWKLADPTWGAKRLKFMQFNRNDGRHLVYGELEQVLAINRTLDTWALVQADHVLSSERSLRFVASSTSDQVLFLPNTSVKRIWDGRWLNTLIAWGLVTLFLCKYRHKIIPSSHSKSKS